MYWPSALVFVEYPLTLENSANKQWQSALKECSRIANFTFKKMAVHMAENHTIGASKHNMPKSDDINLQISDEFLVWAEEL